MRISTTQFSNVMRTAMQKQTGDLAGTFNDISSGKRIQQPSDDPLATVKIQHLNKEVASLEQYVSNVSLLQGSLQQEDTLLANMVNIVQRTRETVLSAGNGVYDDGDLKALAGDINSQIDELRSLANYRQADGQYLFSGTRSLIEPVQIDGERFQYGGNSAQRMVAISSSTGVVASDSAQAMFFNKASVVEGAGNSSASNRFTLSVDSSFVDHASIALSFDGTGWTAIPTDWEGNNGAAIPVTVSGDRIDIDGVGSMQLTGTPAPGDNYTVENVDTFTALSRFSALLEGGGDQEQAIEAALIVVGSTIDTLGEVQTNVGGRLNMLDSTMNSHQDVLLMDEVLRSELQDLDYSEAISRLNLQQTALEASRQAYMKIQGLSLFTYLQ